MAKSRHDESPRHDGLNYPVGHLVGVLRTAEEAEQAAQSLYAADFTDIEILEGSAARAVIESEERAVHPLTRAWERLSLYLSDETDARQAALEALSEGHAIVMVSASDDAQEDQAKRILQAHGGRALRYFGRWSITEFGRIW
jgi:hypothetical protein